MPSHKLTPADRRALVLRGLRGESPSKLAKEYGVARSWVYALLDEAKTDPEEAVWEAHKEAFFREQVLKRLQASE